MSFGTRSPAPPFLAGSAGWQVDTVIPSLPCRRRLRRAFGGMELDAPSLVEKVLAVELGTSHYMATPEYLLWHARQADDAGKVSQLLSAVIVDEISVWDYNRV